MFRENRVSEIGLSPNTPEGWAKDFRGARTLSRLKTLQLQRSPEFRWIRKFLTSPIMDGGCGAGQWVAFLQSQGFQAHGLDYSEEMIARNRERYPQSDWTVGDIRNASFPDNSFGGIISWGVVEHDEAGPQAALREFYRLMKPGACAVVTVPLDHERQRRAGLSDNTNNAGDFFQYYYTVPEFEAEMCAAGFEIAFAGGIPVRAIGLAVPKLYSRFVKTRWFILARIAALFVPKAKCCGMLAVVGRKPLK